MYCMLFSQAHLHGNVCMALILPSLIMQNRHWLLVELCICHLWQNWTHGEGLAVRGANVPITTACSVIQQCLSAKMGRDLIRLERRFIDSALHYSEKCNY